MTAFSLPALTPDPAIKAGTYHLDFPAFQDVPLGHTLFQITDEGMAPYAQPGDWAVIDCTDRSIQFGEYFLIRQSVGPIIWMIMRPNPRWKILSDHPCVYLRRASLQARQFGLSYAGDGPLCIPELQKIIIGRVVGLFDGLR